MIPLLRFGFRAHPDPKQTPQTLLWQSSRSCHTIGGTTNGKQGPIVLTCSTYTNKSSGTHKVGSTVLLDQHGSTVLKPANCVQRSVRPCHLPHELGSKWVCASKATLDDHTRVANVKHASSMVQSHSKARHHSGMCACELDVSFHG